MDRFTNIILWAGFGCFVFAFLLSGLYPWLITDAKEREASIEEVANPVTEDFKALKSAYPVAFRMAFENADACLTDREIATQDIAPDDPRRAASDQAWVAAHAKSLRDGRDIYIAEACWHCHSQFVRPVANEEVRFGPVQTTRHDNNALQRPVLWGTRRVGPDLTHEGGKRSNDWHIAHLWDPQGTTPGSIMPRYVWYFREGFEVRRRISEETADMEGASADISHPYPGLYPTKEEAERVMADLQENPPPNLDEEVERLFVTEGRGPAPQALHLVAYLQWLGTWEPPALGEEKAR
jgi:cbb3-type cytochrome c oxidase subunit II